MVTLASFTRITPSNYPPEIREYIDVVRGDEPRAAKEQHALVDYIDRVFTDEELYVDLPRLKKYLSLERFLVYKLFPWQRFVIALWLCTYTSDYAPRWKTFFGMLARGAGKDGFIAFIAMCLMSPANPIQKYDIDICANNEEQAVRPVHDLADTLEGDYSDILARHYYHTKELVRGKRNKGTMRGRTNNPKNRDGMRSGCVIFNEVHNYQNYDNISVFVSGLGKVGDPRVGILTSNGHVSDGPLDDYLETSKRILFEGEDDRGFLPFVCCLADKSEVDDPDNWSKANPSWAYLPQLRRETEEEYNDWRQYPERNGDFLAKRMGLRAGFKELSVTDYEKVLATKKPLPDLKRKECVVGIDYAELSDWASVVYHFKIGKQRYDICHTWVCTRSKTLSRVRAPWEMWADKGYITRVDAPAISPEMLAEDIYDMGKFFSIRKLAMDNHKLSVLGPALKAVGFDPEDKSKVRILRPSDIMKADVLVQYLFDNDLFSWGDCPPLRWAVNNTKRVPASKKMGFAGNYYYAKIEAKSRKTDPWMALVAALTIESEIKERIALTDIKLPPVFIAR